MSDKDEVKDGNEVAAGAEARPAPAKSAGSPPAENHDKLRQIRSRVAASFSQVAILLMNTPRYRHQSIADLDWLVLEPLLRDRIAIASSKPGEGADGSLVGVAYWASVSDEVGAKIEEQARSGNFPVRLKPAEWNSGDQIWLLDVIAPDRKLATAVLASFGQIAKGRPVHIHPIVTRLVDPEVLMKLRPAKQSARAFKVN